MTAPEDLVTSQHAEETSSRSDFDAESHDEDFDAEAENGRVKVTSSRERRSASCKKSSAASLIPNALYAEDGDGDDGLTVGVVIAVLLLSVALVLLANMTANQKLLMTETEKLVESCETSQWSEWTACTPLCSAGYSTRRRIITVLGADPALCPSLVERRECVAECRAFAIARPTTERLTDQQIANFPACYGDLRKAIEEALDLGRDRSSITSMRTDLSTGSKFWQLEFVLYPDGNGAAETYDADPNRFAEDVVRKVFAALQGTPTTLARLISHCMPSDDVSNHVATYTAGTLEEIAAGRSTCSLFAGVSPFGCNCVVSEWSPWTVCDKQCSQRTAKRFRSIQHAEAFIDPQVDCPSLFEERPCAGSSKIFQVDLPTGVSLGTEAQRRAQFEYCSADLLASLAKTLQLSRAVLAHSNGWNAPLSQWKFSITVDPSVMTVDNAYRELEKTLSSQTSELYRALIQCFNLQNAPPGQMPAIIPARAPGLDRVCAEGDAEEEADSGKS